MAKKRAGTSASTLLPPVSFEGLNLQVLSGVLAERDVRRLRRIMADERFDSLRHQVFVLARVLRIDMAVDLTDADLSAVFGKSGSWSRGMIENYKKSLESSARVGPGRRPLVPPDMDQELVQFCLARQRDKAPVTICDLINYLEAKSIAVDRSWVHRFLERNEKELAVQKARFIEKARYEVTPEDIKAYFEIVKESADQFRDFLCGTSMKRGSDHRRDHLRQS